MRFSFETLASDVSENASAFIGLEENPVGNKFKEMVIATVQQSRK